MYAITAASPTPAATLPAAMESAPRLGPTGALLKIGQRRRQRPRAKQDRQLLRSLDGENYR